jgi:hypothetical protein
MDEGDVTARLYLFCGNDAPNSVDYIGLCEIYAVAWIDGAYRRVESTTDVPIETERIIEAEGYFDEDIPFSCRDCNIIFPVKIAVDVNLLRGLVAVGDYTYQTHAQPGNYGGMIRFPVGTTHSPRDEVEEHEKGHSDAWFAYFLPCVQRRLGANRCCD